MWLIDRTKEDYAWCRKKNAKMMLTKTCITRIKLFPRNRAVFEQYFKVPLAIEFYGIWKETKKVWNRRPRMVVTCFDLNSLFFVNFGYITCSRKKFRDKNIAVNAYKDAEISIKFEFFPRKNHFQFERCCFFSVAAVKWQNMWLLLSWHPIIMRARVWFICTEWLCVSPIN